MFAGFFLCEVSGGGFGCVRGYELKYSNTQCRLECGDTELVSWEKFCGIGFYWWKLWRSGFCLWSVCGGVFECVPLRAGGGWFGDFGDWVAC